MSGFEAFKRPRLPGLGFLGPRGSGFRGSHRRHCHLAEGFKFVCFCFGIIRTQQHPELSSGQRTTTGRKEGLRTGSKSKP